MSRQSERRQERMISADLAQNLAAIRREFFADKNSDIIIREFQTGGGVFCFLAYLDGMADSAGINDFIIRALMNNREPPGRFQKFDVLQYNNCVSESSLDQAIASILQGDTPVFFQGDADCAVCETKGFERRSVTEPLTESVIKGSHEAFNENVRTNITLVRRKLKTPQLCTEFVTVGKISGEKCAVLYLENLTNRNLLREVKRRLSLLEGDFISGCGMVEQMIEDDPLSLFPSILSTERPDRAAGYLSAGRVIVLCDNTPFALVMPVTLSILLDSPETDAQRWQNGTFSRLIRMFALFCTTLLPGLYIALICFHREMIPTALLSAIAAAQVDIPFPSLLELLLMEIFFELVREAGLRVPSAVGSAIGVVGGLILGQSAVEANLVSPVTLIIVAISGLGNVALPDYDLAFGIRVIKLVFILLGGLLGFLGVTIAALIFLFLLANQTSFGVPMLSIQALRWSAGANLFYQRPLWKQELRSKALRAQRERQQPPISRAWGRRGGKEKRRDDAER